MPQSMMNHYYKERGMDGGDGDGDDDGDNTSWRMRSVGGGDCCELCGFFVFPSLGWHGCLLNLYWV